MADNAELAEKIQVYQSQNLTRPYKLTWGLLALVLLSKETKEAGRLLARAGMHQHRDPFGNVNAVGFLLEPELASVSIFIISLG